jgi:hypothetical protein
MTSLDIGLRNIAVCQIIMHKSKTTLYATKPKHVSTKPQQIRLLIVST